MLIIQLKCPEFRSCILNCGEEKEAFSTALAWIGVEMGAERSDEGFPWSLVQDFYAWLPGYLYRYFI